MNHKRRLIPAICVLLAAMMAVLGCLDLDYPNYVTQQYAFDGDKPPYTPIDPDWDEYIADFTEALERAPESAVLYYHRGNAYLYKGEYDKAIADYTKAIDLRPEQDQAYNYNMRGKTYYCKGEYDKAIADCNNAIAIELDPKYTAVYYYNRGFSYHCMGEYDKAIADYTKAVELDSTFGPAYYRRGLVYKTKGEYDIAASDFEKVLQVTARHPKLVEAAQQALESVGK